MEDEYVNAVILKCEALEDGKYGWVVRFYAPIDRIVGITVPMPIEVGRTLGMNPPPPNPQDLVKNAEAESRSYADADAEIVEFEHPRPEAEDA